MYTKYAHIQHNNNNNDNNNPITNRLGPSPRCNRRTCIIRVNIYLKEFETTSSLHIIILYCILYAICCLLLYRTGCNVSSMCLAAFYFHILRVLRKTGARIRHNVK